LADLDAQTDRIIEALALKPELLFSVWEYMVDEYKLAGPWTSRPSGSLVRIDAETGEPAAVVHEKQNTGEWEWGVYTVADGPGVHQWHSAPSEQVAQKAADDKLRSLGWCRVGVSQRVTPYEPNLFAGPWVEVTEDCWARFWAGESIVRVWREKVGWRWEVTEHGGKQGTLARTIEEADKKLAALGWGLSDG